jgi:hypothetical protein
MISFQQSSGRAAPHLNGWDFISRGLAGAPFFRVVSER